MKKILSFILCFIFILSESVFAAENDKTSDMLKTVKERLSISDNYDDFSSSSYEDNFSKVYSFSWNDSEKGENLNVSCTDGGIITSYYNYIPEYNASEKPAFSDDLYSKAKNTAEAFVKKINPQLADKILFKENNNLRNTFNRNFSFEFFVCENGYKVSTNNGYVSVNQTAERVTSFDLSYISDVDFKKYDKILSKEDAVLLYEEKLGLKLVYKMYRDEKTTTVYPAFVKKENLEKYIDAVTGEVYSPPTNHASPLYKTMNTSSGGAFVEDAKADRASFSEIELKGLDILNELISKEKAEEIIRKSEIIKIPDDLILSSALLSQDYYEKETYNYNLTFKSPENKNFGAKRTFINLRAVVDAKSGTIKSFNKYYIDDIKKTDKEKNKISEATAIKKADIALMVLGAEHKEDFKLSKNSGENSYNYTYVREVNGIPFISNVANVSVDPYSGEIISWSITHTEAKFPELNDVLSEKDATKKLFEQVNYEPIYIVSNDGNKYHCSLVYTITDNYDISLNAKTGMLINYKGEDITNSNSSVKYTDIDGHYAKEEIEKLASYGIAISGKNVFSPDASISQKELLAYILMAFDGEKNLSVETDENIKHIYRRAIKCGFITEEEKFPDSFVSRGETAKIIVRALGYSEIAEIEGIYNSPFADCKDLNGYLSILYGLGIASGDGNGCFYPEKNITNAETSVMLYNYLSK